MPNLSLMLFDGKITPTLDLDIDKFSILADFDVASV
mgnify:CR=1 FL=1